MSTHILAPELSEAALREALRAGRAYVSHDWMCDPTGFRFELIAEPEVIPSTAISARRRVALIGDAHEFTKGLQLTAAFPVSCRIRLIKSGTLVAEHLADRIDYALPGPGVYRVEGWLESAGESRAGSIQTRSTCGKGSLMVPGIQGSCRRYSRPQSKIQNPNPKSKMDVNR